MISFEPHDMEWVNTPHNDVMFIRDTVANYDIARLLMDSGSLINIIFEEAFSQMQLGEYKMEAVEISLV